MGVVIEKIRFKNEFSTEETDYLIGNIGDKVTITIDFRAEDVFVTAADSEIDRILLAPQPFRVNVPDSKDVIFCENPNAFVNYKVGDTYILNIGGIDQTERYIYEKLSDQAFRVHQVAGSPGDTNFYLTNGNTYDTPLGINDYIFLSTDLTAITYRYNFVGNGFPTQFINPLDGELNQLRIGGIDNADTVTQVALEFDSPVTNNIGSAYVVGNGSTSTAQKFKIVHETYITPLFLGIDYSNFKNNIAPDYFFADECLKHVLSIDVGRNISDPNFIETIDYDAKDGNSGWVGENYNGGSSVYNVDSINYKRLDTSSIDSIELTENEQTVEIIVSSDNATFSDGNTEFSLIFSTLIRDADDYTNNGKTLRENFYFDDVKNVVDGVTSVAGNNYGNRGQVFKGVVGEFIDSSHIKITATIELTSLGVSDLASISNLEYFFLVSTEDYTLDTEESDRVPLLADIETFYVDLSDDGLISFEDKFLRHYETDLEIDGTTSPIVRTEDDVLVRSRFSIDRLGRETDEILINSVGTSIIAKKSDGSEFTLEQFSQSLNGTQVIGDTQFIDIESERSFQMPDGDIRKTISVKRRIDLDTADLRYYDVVYPFLMRWEYWNSLGGVNGDAFNVAEPNNGQNQEWQRYDTIADWDIYYRTEVNLTKNGNSLNYQNDTLLETYDYREDTEWADEEILALNADTLAPQGTLLVNPTIIKVNKTYIGSNPPSLMDVVWVLRIEVYEQGGISDIRYLSSIYDWTENSWFNSVDNSNKVYKSVSGSVYSAEALINFNDLPDNSTFKISARIYNEDALPPFCCLATEDNNPIMLETGNDCISPDTCEEPVPSDVPYESETCNLDGEFSDSLKYSGGYPNLERIANFLAFFYNFVGYNATQLEAIEYTYEIIARGGDFSDATFTDTTLEVSVTGNNGNYGGGLGGLPTEDAIPLDSIVNENTAGNYLVVDCYARDAHCGFEFKYRIGYGQVPAEYLVNGQKRGVIHKIEWQP